MWHSYRESMHTQCWCVSVIFQFPICITCFFSYFSCLWPYFCSGFMFCSCIVFLICLAFNATCNFISAKFNTFSSHTRFNSNSNKQKSLYRLNCLIYVSHSEFDHISVASAFALIHSIVFLFILSVDRSYVISWMSVCVGVWVCCPRKCWLSVCGRRRLDIHAVDIWPVNILETGHIDIWYAIREWLYGGSSGGGLWGRC